MTGLPGSLEWTAAKVAELDQEETRMHPLSIVFRVDATDDADARRQLGDIIATAAQIKDALTPATGHAAAMTRAFGHPDVDDRDVTDPTVGVLPLDAEPLTTHVHIDPTGKPIRRPWAPGQDGMGQ